MRRLHRFGFAVAASAALCALACYDVPQLLGPYRCLDDGTCADPSMLCDDGLCCRPGGTPACRTLVYDGGVCLNGQPAATWYLDKDGDGRGDENSARLACARPFTVPESAPGAEWIELGGDCNDDDPGIRPGAEELCDQIDNDCDGEVDEGFTKLAFYADADRDGFGRIGSTPQTLCAPYLEYTANNAEDCDDANAEIRPGVIEVCDGVDNDCNGVVDDNVPEVGQACETGQQGVCRPGKRVCDASGNLVCQRNVDPGTEVCNGLDDNCDGAEDESFATCSQDGGSCCLQASLYLQGGRDMGVRTALADPGACALDAHPGKGSVTSFDGRTWRANGRTTQVAWFEKSGGWNFSGDTLSLQMTVKLLDPQAGWTASKQPVVILCGADGGYARYVHAADTNWDTKPAEFNLNTSIPLTATGGNGWTQTRTNPPLTKVQRVEILMESNGADAGFEVTFRRVQVDPP